MAKKLIHFTATFSGSIEVDTEDYDESFTDEDIICDMTHQELFAACETDLNPEVDFVETTQ